MLVALPLLFQGYYAAQTPKVLDSPQLAPVVSLQFVNLPKAPLLPDYQAIRTSYDAHVTACEALGGTLEGLSCKLPPPPPPPIVEAPPAPALPLGDAKLFIYSHESGNNPGAINRSSGACGLGQALPCSKMPCSLSDYACQDVFFTGYMQQRYGSWDNAMAFWQLRGWW